MSDNTKKRGRSDRSKVNSTQIHELRYWARKFKATHREIVLAVWLLRSRDSEPIARDVKVALDGATASVRATRERVR